MDFNTTWMVDEIAAGVRTSSGTYYKAGCGKQLPSCIFECRDRTIMLLVDLSDRIVYAGVGYSVIDDVGYVNHAVLADEIGIPVGADFDGLVRPVFRDSVLSFNRVQVGTPVDTDMCNWDTDEFRSQAFKNVLHASRILVSVGMSKDTSTICEWVILPLGVFVR